MSTKSTVAGAFESEKRRALFRLGRNDRPFAPESIRVSGLQSWTGRVLEVDGDVFTAELVPSDRSGSVQADFQLQQLGPEQKVVPGDVVYVTVRTVRGPGGYPNTTSSVRLRRLGNWTEEEIARQNALAKQRAEGLKDLIE